MNQSLQTVIVVIAPFLAVLLGVLFNNQRMGRLEAQLGQLEVRLEARMDRLEARMNRLEARMDALQTQSHADSLSILKAMTELHERVARVEARQGA